MYLLTGLFIVTTLEVSSQSVEEAYSDWLEKTPLGAFMEVKEYDDRSDVLFLTLQDHYSGPDEIKRAYVTWDSLMNAYQQYNMELPELLIYQLQRWSQKALNELSIKITSAIPVLFNVVIHVADGRVTYQIDYLDVRGNELTAFVTNGFFPLANVVPLDFSVQKAKEVVSATLTVFFKEEFNVDQHDISYSEKGTVGERYQIDKKSLFSDQLNDRVIIALTYIKVNEERTEINLELIAYAARGIIKPGAYKPIDNTAYLLKVSAIQANFANQLYLSAKR